MYRMGNMCGTDQHEGSKVILCKAQIMCTPTAVVLGNVLLTTGIGQVGTIQTGF